MQVEQIFQKGSISNNKLNNFIDQTYLQNQTLAIMITDLNYLKTMSGGDSKFIREMIDLFREQVEEYKILMLDLLQKKDYDGLSKIAHKAKSSVAVMGMSQVADLLKELEIITHEEREVERYETLINHFLEQSELAIIELDSASK